MTFAEDLRMEVMCLLLGESEAKFLSHCSRIFAAHKMPRTGARILRMEADKAISKIKEMTKADEFEMKSLNPA